MSGAARLGLCALVALSACTDFSSPEDPTNGLADTVVVVPSFARDVQPIFTKTCARGGCHSVASHQVGLVLQQGYAYGSIVNVPSVTGAPLLRVQPFDSDASWLVRAIQPDDARRPGLPRMPLDATPLSPNQIQTIVNWIDRGAGDN